MKKIDLFLTIILIPIDFLMIIGAGITAYFFRFSDFYTRISPVNVPIEFKNYLVLLILMALFLMICFAFVGLYTISSGRKLVTELIKVFSATSFALVVIVFMFFFQKDIFASRFIILAAWGLTILYVSLSRILLRLFRFFLYKKGIGTKNVLIIGKDHLAKILSDFFKNHTSYGYKVSAVVSNLSENYVFKKIKKMIKKKNIDEIIQLDPNLSKEVNSKLIDLAYEMHVVYRYAPDFYGTQIKNVEIMPIDGIPIITLKQTPLEKWGYIYKRIFDFLVSLILLIILSPVLLIIAILIKLDSRGPVIYKSKRLGEKGKPFYMYKFRTMYIKYCTGEIYANNKKALEIEAELIKQKSERKGPLYKVLDDPRRTKLGKFLEKTSLDELPSFFNSLIGNMSLVGPRPHQPREVAKYEARHRRILEIKPGITGLAQISGRSDLDFEEEARLDIFYIENWSFLLDLIILFKTPFALLRGHKH